MTLPESRSRHLSTESADQARKSSATAPVWRARDGHLHAMDCTRPTPSYPKHDAPGERKRRARPPTNAGLIRQIRRRSDRPRVTIKRLPAETHPSGAPSDRAWTGSGRCPPLLHRAAGMPGENLNSALSSAQDQPEEKMVPHLDACRVTVMQGRSEMWQLQPK